MSSSQRVWDGGIRQDSMAGMGLREQSEQWLWEWRFSSGCRVLTLQGYDIEEILYPMSLRMIGGGYFQLGEYPLFLLYRK